MSRETYNGYANRETWAFCLHINNDQGLYNDTVTFARDLIGQDSELTDFSLGEQVADYWSDVMDEYEDDSEGGSAPEFRNTLRMFRREVGSWWRLDYREIGANVRESVSNEAE